MDVGTTDLVQLTMTNSNVISEFGGGIYNGNIDNPDDFDEEGLFVSYCNVMAAEDRITNAVEDNILEVDPMFVGPSVDPEAFTRDGFKLASDSPLVSAGEGGTYIGSQGPEGSSISDWAIR